VDFFSSVFWSWHLRTVEILIPVPGIWAAPPTSIIGRSFFLAVISAPFCLDLPCARVFLRQDFSFPASTVRTPPVGRSAEHRFFRCFLCSGVWAGYFQLTGSSVLGRTGCRFPFARRSCTVCFSCVDVCRQAGEGPRCPAFVPYSLYACGLRSAHA
jgi:hypothetical protein